VAGLFVLGLLIAGFFVWWYVPKATVTVYVLPQKIENKINLTVDTTSATEDLASGKIAGEIVKTMVSGEKTKSTTGTKLIGEKRPVWSKFKTGLPPILFWLVETILTSVGNLKFVTVKSASVSAALSPSLPGEASVEIAADAIGAESNLAKDEIFKIGNYPKSEVDAVSTANFSGGTSRQITAVSAQDKKT